MKTVIILNSPLSQKFAKHQTHIEPPQFLHFIFGGISRKNLWVVIWVRGSVAGPGPKAADGISAKKGGPEREGSDKKLQNDTSWRLASIVKIHALIGSRCTDMEWIGVSCCADLHT